MSPKRLEGKTVLVVGADGNLGPLWVQALLEEGATVWGLGLAASKDSALQNLSRDTPGLVLGDVDLSKSVERLTIEEALGVSLTPGSLDGVLLNAGIDSVPGTGHSSFEDYDRADWERVFGVNVFGVVECLNSVLDALAVPSSVVMLGSLYGVVAPNPALMSHYAEGKGLLKHPAYGASKAALVAVAKHYGTNLAPQGVRVNTLTLGGVEAGPDDAFIQKYSALSPQGRMLRVEELMGAMVFLLSDDSRAMNGHNLLVDGGFTAW